jgi:hypothetical protein
VAAIEGVFAQLKEPCASDVNGKAVRSRPHRTPKTEKIRQRQARLTKSNPGAETGGALM